MCREVCFKNGLTIALTDAIVRDYGKWHRVNVVISNNSLTPIEFNPETDIIAYSVDKHDVATDLQVWSYNSYLKKVNRSQTWSVVLKGVSEGLASARVRLFDLHNDRLRQLRWLQQLRRPFLLYGYDHNL